MPITVIDSSENFTKFIEKNELLVIHFWADWAAQCGPMDKVMEELTKDDTLKNVHFAKIPAEEFPEISLKYKVNAVPTFILLHKQKIIDRVDGANASELTTKVKQTASREIFNIPQTETVPVDVNEKLKTLVNSAPALLFMKGTRDAPFCGFSKQAIEILDKYKALYSTFDILTDESVRQGLKKYSDWPTFPQLYVKGKFIGGVDIMKEMGEELSKILPKKSPLEVRLNELVNQHPVMVFMKGTRDAPRCGFSRQLMQILKGTGLNFQTFDILEDEEVRQGLKKFSDWPTYPQVYVKGDLIGGLDIIKELQGGGELILTLNPEA